ncbi:MAG: RNA polymerase sigma factor [Reichenbachiella sp.]
MVKKDSQSICKEATFKGIFEKYNKEVYQFLYYKYGSDNNPQDLVQEAFIKLWDNCKNVPIDKARSFLFTVANNQMLNALSRRKTVLNFVKEDHKTTTFETPEYLMEENEYSERLQLALESLTEEQRVTFMLNRVEGKKHQEIADLLEISRKAVEKRIYTTLKILKSKLENFG